MMKHYLYSQILCIAAAYVLDAIVGDPLWFPHPVRFMGSFINHYKKRFYDLSFSADRLRRRGLGLVISSVLFFGGITFLLLWLCFHLHPVLYYIINTILLCTCLAPTCMIRETRKIHTIVCSGDLAASRKQLSYIVGRDTTQLSMENVILATVETTAENTSDGTISPLLYMMLGGAPLAMMFKMASTMDSMVGYDNDAYHDFGRYPAKNDDLLNYIPSRLAALCLILAALLPGYSARNAWRIVKRDHANHLSPNCGYPEAASSGALGLRMGGTHVYFGKVVEKPYIGDDLHTPKPDDILRMNRLMYTACTIFLILGLGIMVLMGVWL